MQDDNDELNQNPPKKWAPLKSVKAWFENLVDGAAPAQREVYTAYARINKDGLPAGTFVLTLYQLARKPGGLRVQLFEQAYIDALKAVDKDYVYHSKHLLEHADTLLVQDLVKRFYPESKLEARDRVRKVLNTLYHSDGTAKSAFELAMIPTHHEDEIERVFKKEMLWQMQDGMVPQLEFKVRLSEWLQNLEAAGYEYADPKATRFKGMTFTIPNAKPKFKEKALHFFMDKMAYASALFATLTAFLLTASPVTGFAWGVAVYLTSINEKAFDAFDYAERLWQDLRWNLSKNVANTRKFDSKKALNSLIFVGSLVAVMYSATLAAFHQMLAAPLVSSLPWVLGAGLAFAVTAWGFANVVLGRSIPYRFINGLGFHNNAISTDKMLTARLESVPLYDVHRSKLKLYHAKAQLLQMLVGQDLDDSDNSSSVLYDEQHDHPDDDNFPGAVLTKHPRVKELQEQEFSHSHEGSPRRSLRLNREASNDEEPPASPRCSPRLNRS